MIEDEVKRFSRIWESSRRINEGKIDIILALFLSTVDPDIVSEVELRIRDKYFKI